MTREWKPGDVAMVTYGTSTGDETALCFRRGSWWMPADQGIASLGSSLGEVSEVRPLLVIDPESIEDVVRVRDACWRGGTEETWQDHLRSLLAPPKPDEPTGLGAVVEDESGRRYVRQHDGWWRGGDEPCSANWAAVDAVRVLSEGVQS